MCEGYDEETKRSYILLLTHIKLSRGDKYRDLLILYKSHNEYKIIAMEDTQTDLSVPLPKVEKM